MRRCGIALLALLVLATPAPAAQRALFDNTKAETAGNADWVVDDNQPVPSPAQSGIAAGTPETYWTGALSSWGVALVKRGYTVATLTTAYGITYGNAANPYDLSNYDVFIVDEPNVLFPSAEATAILDYVRGGGGLIAIADHYASDRNNDGYDSPMIWNAMDPTHLLGVRFGVNGDANNNVSQTSTNVNVASRDSITRGPVGNVNAFAFFNGTTMTLYPGVNPSVRGEVWMNGTSQSSTTGVMAASAVYGDGRVVFVGDSSPADDGTASPGNSVYNDWGLAPANDSTLFLNATLWAARRPAAADTQAPSVQVTAPVGGERWDLGSVQTITWTASDNVGVDSVDVDCSLTGAGGPWLAVAHGLANSGSYVWTLPAQASDSALVRVTAYDAALNAGSAGSDSLFHIVDPAVGVGESGRPVLALARPQPNPSRGVTRLTFSLPQAGRASLEILDLGGRRLWASGGFFPAGPQSRLWDGSTASGGHVAAGLYFVRLTTPWGNRVGRLIRLE